LGEQLIYRDDPADCSTPDLTRLARLQQVTEISIPGVPITEGLSHTEESAGKASAGKLGTIEAPHA
jgi:hypothetical protein